MAGTFYVSGRDCRGSVTSRPLILTSLLPKESEGGLLSDVLAWEFQNLRRHASAGSCLSAAPLAFTSWGMMRPSLVLVCATSRAYSGKGTNTGGRGEDASQQMKEAATGFSLVRLKHQSAVPLSETHRGAE